MRLAKRASSFDGQDARRPSRERRPEGGKGSPTAPEVTPHYEGGSGEPLVLLHGIQASWSVWKAVLPLLESHHAVFAPTIAGHRGALPLPDGTKASAATLADALELGLDEAGIERAHFAGNSLGGWLALEMARRSRALSVTAISPAGAFLTDRDRDRVVRMLSQARRMGVALGPKLGALVRRPRGRRLLVRIASERGDLIPAAELAASFEDLAACTIFEDFVASIRTEGGLAAGIDTSRQPILVAWAERDRVLPFERYGQPMLDLLPGAEHVTLPGVGHVPMYDDPELVARTILEVTARARSNGTPAAKETHTMTTTTDFDLAGARGRIAGRSWPNADARYAALLAHGFGEHGGRYEHVAAALVDDGAAVYAPDHYGHGRSEGAERALVDDIEVMVDDLRLAADHVRSEHPGLPLVLLGHSMGGLIATRFAQRHRDELAALVLSAPFLGNPAFAGLLAMEEIPDIPVDPAILSRDPAVGEAYAADELVYHGPIRRETLEGFFAAIGDVGEGGDFGDLPTLWIHGEGDQLAPIEVSREVLGRAGGSAMQARSYPGAQHEILNETNKDEVLTDVTSFLDGALKS